MLHSEPLSARNAFGSHRWGLGSMPGGVGGLLPTVPLEYVSDL